MGGADRYAEERLAVGIGRCCDAQLHQPQVLAGPCVDANRGIGGRRFREARAEDHVGLGAYASLAGSKGKGAIHNGADDNSSGTSSVLEIAVFMKARRTKLKRDILFLLFTMISAAAPAPAAVLTFA